ncbi:MAG: hypothetical protein R2713_00370 [Ilumatobacteraceae bacterium]
MGGAVAHLEGTSALALAAIDRMRGERRRRSGPPQRRAGPPAGREAAATELLAMVEGDPAHGQLAAIACSAAWLPVQRTKTNIRCIHEMRMAISEFGAAWWPRVRSTRSRTSGSCAHGRSGGVHRRPTCAFTDTIRERRGRYRVQELVPPFVFVGRTDGPDTWVRHPAHLRMLGAGDTMAGLPGCLGRRRDRVILDSNDPGPGAR